MHRTILQEHWVPDYIKTREWPERVAKSAHCRSDRTSCAAVRWLEKIAALARKPFSKTQFCGQPHKLLPKVSFTVVLSAPKKRSAASIETATSSMRTEFLLRRTRMHFPLLDATDVKIHPIEKGGSDRKFYRIRCSPNQTLILVKYNLEREENRHYVEIAKFLEHPRNPGP